MFDRFRMHYVHPYQRKQRSYVGFDAMGSYKLNERTGDVVNVSSGRKASGSYRVFYVSKECRIDGVVDCIHDE